MANRCSYDNTANVTSNLVKVDLLAFRDSLPHLMVTHLLSYLYVDLLSLASYVYIGDNST